MDLLAETSAQYARFALDAAGSPCFAEWSRGVSTDEQLLALIGELPTMKQQPNLVLAAARWHGVPAPSPYAVFRSGLLAGWPQIRATVLARSTQTNEVGRLATLVPVLARLQALDGRPLALIEVGASAGLCLYPDRYGYDWSTESGMVSTGSVAGAPRLRCTVSGPTPPLPTAPPVVSWRAGVDLNPLDVRDEDATRWLETLVWPEQDERRARLATAVAVARRDPPRLVRGDLLEQLPGLLAQAPPQALPVVFHSAVLAYLDPEARGRFTGLVSDLVAAGRCHWISNEAPGVLPDVTATGPSVPPDLSTFVLGLDGQALAWTHGHGETMRWLEDAPG